MIRGLGGGGDRASSALGVVGDTAGPTGLYATLIAAGVLLLLHAVFIAPFVRRAWWVQGLVLGAVTTLVVGLVFCGAADARLDTPTGLFGVDAGGRTPLVIVLCSLAFGLVATRCYSLIVSQGWWEEHGRGRGRRHRGGRRARARRGVTRTRRTGARTGPRGRLS